MRVRRLSLINLDSKRKGKVVITSLQKISISKLSSLLQFNTKNIWYQIGPRHFGSNHFWEIHIEKGYLDQLNYGIYIGPQQTVHIYLKNTHVICALNYHVCVNMYVILYFFSSLTIRHWLN